MDLANLIGKVAIVYSIPVPLLMAQVQHESSGNPFAIGDGGRALGLMQVHIEACETVNRDWIAIKAAIVAGNADLASELSLDAGAAYLLWCFERMNDWRWALAAYNQGPTVIGRAKRYVDAVLPP